MIAEFLARNAASAYLTMADIARAYHVTTRTARRWAAQDHWRRHGQPMVYSLTDAQASYDKRHGERITRHLSAQLEQGLDNVPP